MNTQIQPSMKAMHAARRAQSIDTTEHTDAPISPPAAPLPEDAKLADAHDAFATARHVFTDAEDAWTSDQTAAKWSLVTKSRDARDRAEALLRRAESDAKHAHERVAASRKADLRKRLDDALEQCSDATFRKRLEPLALRAIAVDVEQAAIIAACDEIERDHGIAQREAVQLEREHGGNFNVPRAKDYSSARQAVAWAMFEGRVARGGHPTDASEGLPIWIAAQHSQPIRHSNAWATWLDAIVAKVRG